MKTKLLQHCSVIIAVIIIIACLQVETDMSTIVNMLVLSIQIFPFPTTMNNLVASSLLNNIVETMLNNIVGATMLLTSDNNVVHATKY